MSQSLSYRVSLAEQVLEAAAGIPTVARHPLSSVIGREFRLVATTIIPAGKLFGRVIDQQRVMGYGTLEIILVVRRIISSGRPLI